MPQEINFEAFLEVAGPFGPYQWLLCAFLWCLAAPLLAAVVYGHMLLLLTPKHWCTTSDIGGRNRTLLERRAEDIPFDDPLTGGDFSGEENKGSIPGFSQCRMYSSWLTDQDETIFNTSNLRQITTCQNGWEYDFSKVYPTVISELDWVCDESWRAYLAHTAFWAGGAVGVIVFGIMADRLGRRPVIVITHLICAIFGVATNFITSFEGFVVGRAAVGFAALPMSMAAYVLMLEYVSSSWRLTVSTVYLFSYSLIGCILPWIAYVIDDWRIFNLCTTAPAFTVPLFCGIIPESLRWMFANNQEERAKRTLLDIARINGRVLPQDLFAIPLAGEKKANTRRESVVTMVRLPNLRRIYFITVVTWILMSCCYIGGYVHAATLSDNPFLMISVNSAMDLLANAIGDRMANRFGRRITMVSSSALCSVTFLISCSDHLKGNQVALTLVMMVGRVTLTTAYNVNYLYGAEVYPTVVRTQALSIRQALGAVGSFMSPQVVYLSVYSRQLPLLIFSCMALASSILCLILPETLNTSLPETLSDGEALIHPSWPLLTRLHKGISAKLHHQGVKRTECINSETTPCTNDNLENGGRVIKVDFAEDYVDYAETADENADQATRAKSQTNC